MKKRLLSALLALCLALALLPAAAFAANSDFIIDENGVLTRYTGPGGDVVIPDGVTSIGDYAFSRCRGLTGITIPASVTTIGDCAFYECAGLTGVTIFSSGTTIGSWAFYNCTSLTNVTVFGDMTEIVGGAFSGCTSLTDVTISGSVTEIGDWAFSGCASLKSVTVFGDVTEIGDWAFYNCTSLTTVTVSGDVATIGNSAFSSCTGLTNVTVSGGVTEISDWAFSGCTSLTNVTIFSSGTTIGSWAFYNCTSLTNVTVFGDMTEIVGGAFSGCTSLTDVTISGSVTEIGDWAFSGCTSLTSVTISGSVDSIGYGAFYECASLKSVTISGGVTSVGEFAFSGCTALEEFTGYPEEAFYERLAANQALLDGWSNPGQYVNAQSARITALANELTVGLTSDYEKARAIAAWVSENIEYDHDYYEGRKNTVVIDPEGVLDSRLTVCDGYARLTMALLRAVGIPARYIVSRDHAWNMAFVDGRWIWMDTTWGMSYFDCGNAYMALGHKPRGSYSASAADTPSVWAQDEVWEAICKGLVPNDLQAVYRDGMTREEFCRLMVSLLEKASGQSIDGYLAAKGMEAKASFKDTDSAAVAAAYTLGIVNGRSETVFDPNGKINRQEAANMLARTAEVLGLTAGDAESFADEGQFSSWAGEGIAFVSGLTDPATGGKVMNGVGNGNFAPKDPYNRQQAILTALRLLHCAA